MYCEDVDVDLIKDSELKLVTFNSLKQGVVKVVILGCPDNFEYHDVVLLALMQGALIATENCKYLPMYYLKHRRVHHPPLYAVLNTSKL